MASCSIHSCTLFPTTCIISVVQHVHSSALQLLLQSAQHACQMAVLREGLVIMVEEDGGHQVADDQQVGSLGVLICIQEDHHTILR